MRAEGCGTEDEALAPSCHASSAMSREPNHQDSNTGNTPSLPQHVSGSGSLYLTERQITTIQGRLRSQVLVARSPGRLPHVAVCSVLFLVVFAGAAVSTCMLLLDGAFAAPFHRIMSFPWPADGSTDADNNANTVDLLIEPNCQTDACTWAEKYLRGKLNWSVNPCSDFYAHVCSLHWTARDLDLQSRVYREMTAGALMAHIEKFFQSYLKEHQARYQRYPGVFLHQAISLLSRCHEEEKSDKNFASMRALLEAYNLGHWPYSKTPNDTTVVNISASLDRDLGVFPFARVFLRKLFRDDRGHTIHIDAPSLTLKRYNLAYLGQSPENFTNLVTLALSLFHEGQDVIEQAEGIVVLENNLYNVTSVPQFGEFHGKLRRLKELRSTEEWDWTEYLTILLQGTQQLDRDTLVAILNHEYVNTFALVLEETDAAVLLNYVGYRLLVHISPLLDRAASPLLRLSHDDYLEFVPDRQQACMYLLERLYKHGMRFFGRIALAKKNITFLPRYNYRLENQIKSSVTGRLISSSSWLERSTIGIAVDMIENMQLVFLDSKDDINTIATYYDFNAQTLDPNHLVQSFRDLQAGTMSIYWKTKPTDGGDLDARYDYTALTTGHEYYFGRNLLFLPLANIAFLSNISKPVDPILIPLIMTEVFRGMFAAVDRRGSSVHPKLAVLTWWSTNDMGKFSQLEHCFQDQYDAEIGDVAGGNVKAAVKLEENIADNAALGPLHDMYMKALASHDGADRLNIAVDNHQLDMEQLFFVLYAVGLCDNPNQELWARKLNFGEVPGRLRINIPLMNFAAFSTAFGCPDDTPMNPARRCTVW